MAEELRERVKAVRSHLRMSENELSDARIEEYITAADDLRSTERRGFDPSGLLLYGELLTPRCTKCGSDELHRQWHRGLSDCSVASRTLEICRDTEHIHVNCQNCGYEWLEDTVDQREE